MSNPTDTGFTVVGVLRSSLINWHGTFPSNTTIYPVHDGEEMSDSKTTGYIQVGDSRLPIDNWEITATVSTEAHVGTFSSWNDRLRASRSIRVEGTYEPTGFIKGLFQVSYPVSYMVWHVVRPWRKHSKQTRAWYRVRARAQRRRKVAVHSHRR